MLSYQALFAAYTIGAVIGLPIAIWSAEKMPMWWMIGTGIGIIYAAGFIFVFIASGAGAGPPDMQLTLLRSLVWPLYVATGHPHGTPYPMD
jgi:hypothetical protein